MNEQIVASAQTSMSVLSRLTGKAKMIKRQIERQTRPILLGWLEHAKRRRSCWVAADRIETVDLSAFPSTMWGAVVGGDWDDLSRSFESLDWHKACVAVFRDGRDWSETDFFQKELSAIGAGRSDNGFVTKTELCAWLRGVEELYRVTRDTGELPGRQQRPTLSVNVGRHGDLVLNSGMEVLSVVRLLGLRRVPVRILVRHPQWMEFRREVCREPRGAYSPLLHPDLEWIPSARTGHDRFELISRALVSQKGTMLDIGCYWGYFCQRFEELGFDCVGVESNPRRYYFLEKLRRANNKRFRIVNMSIFDYIGNEPHEFDVVLALSIFHWFIRTKENFRRLERLLTNIRTRELYFSPHNPDDQYMPGAYWNPAEDEFADFVMTHAGLRTMRYIGRLGRADSNRALYQLTR